MGDSCGFRGTICAMYGCSNYRIQKNSKSFFGFPKTDICKEWLKTTKRADLERDFKERGIESLKHTKICEIHFQESDFKNPKNKTQGLKKGVIPSLNIYTKKVLPRKVRISRLTHGSSSRRPPLTIPLLNLVPLQDAKIQYITFGSDSAADGEGCKHWLLKCERIDAGDVNKEPGILYNKSESYDNVEKEDLHIPNVASQGGGISSQKLLASNSNTDLLKSSVKTKVGTSIAQVQCSLDDVTNAQVQCNLDDVTTAQVQCNAVDVTTAQVHYKLNDVKTAQVQCKLDDVSTAQVHYKLNNVKTAQVQCNAIDVTTAEVQCNFDDVTTAEVQYNFDDVTTASGVHECSMECLLQLGLDSPFTYM